MLTHTNCNPNILKFGCVESKYCWILQKKRNKGQKKERKEGKKKNMKPVAISRGISLKEKSVDHIEIIFVSF